MTQSEPKRTEMACCSATRASGFRIILLVLAALATSGSSVCGQTLFFDDFSGPLGAEYTPTFPNPWDRTYLGPSGYSFQTVDGAGVIRLQNTMGNATVRGWSSITAYPADGSLRLEARFNTLVQSPTTGIDDMLGLWIFDAANLSRFDHVALVAPGYGTYRYSFAYSSIEGGAIMWSPFQVTNNTWYRLVITGSPTQSIRVSIFDDSGTVELAGVDTGHSLTAFPSGIRFGMSQGMGLPYGLYPTDVAVDWLRLSRVNPNATPTGSDISVQPIDSSTGQPSPVLLSFDSVTQAGETTVSSSSSGQPPLGFRVGGNTYYELQTTAQFSGGVKVCFSYAGVAVSPAALKLYHLAGQNKSLKDGSVCTKPNGCWEDITDPLGPSGGPNPDTVNETICGTATSLSPFVLTQPLAITGPSGPVALGVGVQASVDVAGSGLSTIWEWGDGTRILEPGLTGTRVYSAPGVYTVTVWLLHDGRTVGSARLEYIVVYDPTAGFVTGGGWIPSPAGAYAANLALSGKANFGFVSKYLPGANVPSGETQFRFQAAGLDFKSSAYEWLVISGARAQFKGSGTINGSGNYRFILTAIDGEVPGGGGVDRIRIRIWSNEDGGVIYDNQPGNPDSSDNATALGGGSVVIHR